MPPGEAIFAARKKKPIPHAFVLDELERLGPETKPMFGCVAVYVEEKIMLILRDKREPRADNGVWIATVPEHHASLRKELPSMRSISVFGPGVTGWQVLPADEETFEEEALRACELILAGDPRIGKVPGERRGAKKAIGKRPSAKATRRRSR